MQQWNKLGLAVALCLFSLPALAIGQIVPPPLPGQGQYVPITVVVSLDAVGAKLLQEIPAVPQPPAPPQPVAVPGKPAQVPPPGTVEIFPGKKGGLLQKLRELKLLKKIMAGLTDKQEVAKALEKITEPTNLGGDLWLSMNLREIVFQGVALNGKDVAVHLAARLEPVLVLSKERPAPMPLPQLALGKELPPPPPDGTPLDILLKVNPKSLPQILPAETKENLSKYGIDVAAITFAQQAGPKGPKLVVGVPLQKPLTANAGISFTPRIKDNVLTFAEPDCVLTTPKANGKEDNPIQDTLQKLTQDTIRGLVVGKLKTTEVDFTPHIKKMSELPLAPPGTAPAKINLPLTNLRVEDLSAADNHLVVRISGVVGKGGIVITAAPVKSVIFHGRYPSEPEA